MTQKFEFKGYSIKTMDCYYIIKDSSGTIVKEARSPRGKELARAKASIEDKNFTK